MKVYAVIEHCPNNHYSDYIILGDYVYINEEDARKVLKTVPEHAGADIIGLNVIERPKTFATVLSSRMGFVCLSSQVMTDEEDAQIMLGPEEARKLAYALTHAQDCQESHVPARWMITESWDVRKTSKK